MNRSDKKAGFALPDRDALEKVNRLTTAYISTSFLYLIAGMVFGLVMLFARTDDFVFIHVHLLLIGFVIFMIYGVGYKLLPTMFFGYPGLPYIRLSWIQYGVANGGLLGLVMVYTFAPTNSLTTPVLFLAGCMEVGAAFLFVFIMVSCILEKPKQ